MPLRDFFLKTAAAFISPIRYVEKGVDHVKENIKGDIEAMIARATKLAMFFAIGFLFLLFFSAMVAMILNTVLESNIWGYAVIAGFYLLVFIILWLTQRPDSRTNLFRSQARKILNNNNNNR